MRHSIVGNERGGIVKFLLYVIIIGGALYGGYYYFSATPRYTLMQFKKAISFSDAETGEKYLDIDSFINDLPEQITKGASKETLKRRIINEIGAPYDKPMFDAVKKWKTLTIPINIADNVATVEQDDGTTIELEKITDRQWIITSIRFKSQDTGK
jgi:hypothetical protein